MRRSLAFLLAVLLVLPASARADEEPSLEVALADLRAWQAGQLVSLLEAALAKTDVVLAGRFLRDLRAARPEAENLDALAARIAGQTEDAKKASKARAGLLKKHRVYAKAAAKRLAALAGNAGEYRERLAREAVRLDPNSATARTLLVQVRVKGWGWVSLATAAKLKQGLYPVGTEWLGRAEARAKTKNFEHAWVVTSDHWRVRSNLPLERVFVLRDLLELLYARFMDDWDGYLPMRDVKAPFDVWVFAQKAEYDEFTKNDPGRISGVPGQYSPALSRSAFFDVERLAGKGNRVSSLTELMLHECTHQLMHEQFASRFVHFESVASANFWLHEGLCEFYGMHTPKKKVLVLDKKAIKAMVRTAHLRKNPGGQLSIADMDTIQKSDYLGTDMRVRATRYAQSGFLCAFLMQAHPAGFRALLREAYTKQNRTGMLAELVGKDLGALERGFRAFFRAYVR